MTKKEIITYILSTPENTNGLVLDNMLDQLIEDEKTFFAIYPSQLRYSKTNSQFTTPLTIEVYKYTGNNKIRRYMDLSDDNYTKTYFINPQNPSQSIISENPIGVSNITIPDYVDNTYIINISIIAEGKIFLTTNIPIISV